APAALLEEAEHGDPLHVLHGDVRDAVLRARLEDTDDVVRVDLRGGARLALEPLDDPRILRELARDDLERDGPVEVELAREVDRAHAAPAEQALETELSEMSEGGGRARHSKTKAGRDVAIKR